MRLRATEAMIWCLASLLTSCDRSEGTLAGPPEPDPSLAAMSNTWAAKHTLSPWRQDAAATTINGLVYLTGGRRATGSPIPRLDAYDLATDRWTNLPPMPAARYKANGADMINGRLYLTGGFDSRSVASRSLFVYDPPTRSWSTKANVPQASCDGVQGSIGSMLYAYTGCYAQLNPAGVFFRYDPASNTWHRRKAPPTDHSGGVGAVINGKLYLVGGVKPIHCPDPGQPGTCGGDLDNALHVYDPSTDTWTRKAFAPLKLTGQSAVALGGKLWVVGGYTECCGGLNTLVYDPGNNTWSRKAYLPRTTLYGATAMVSGKIIHVSGADDQQPLLPGPSKTYVYTP